MTTQGPRMTLASITSTRQTNRPLRIAVFGPPGIGKTTFASQAPAPIFLCAEDGAAFIEAKQFPKPQSWFDVLDAVDTLKSEEHDFKTLVLDTLDAMESLCWEHVCRTQGGGKSRSIEDFGYGRGYQHAVEVWEKFLEKLEYLQTKRGMNVIMLAHAVARDHKDPDADPYKRWELKLHSKSADVIAGWVDAVLFARPEIVTKKEGLKVRGFDTGERLLHTTSTGAHAGKNRYSLPPVLPLSWADFWAAAQPALRPAPPADPRELAKLKTDLATLVPQLPDDKRQAVADAVEKAGDDPVKLRAFLKRVEAILDSMAPHAAAANA